MNNNFDPNNDEFMQYIGYLYVNGKKLDENGNEVDEEEEEDDEYSKDKWPNYNDRDREDIKRQIAKDLGYAISPMIDDLKKFLDANGLELDENGELVSKKKPKYTLFLKKRKRK